MTADTTDRLTRLEILVTEQEKIIEDISGQIAEQWKVVEAMRRKLDTLTDRFLRPRGTDCARYPRNQATALLDR